MQIDKKTAEKIIDMATELLGGILRVALENAHKTLSTVMEG